MKRTKTIVVGASHWHMPLYADRIAAQHDVVGVSDPDASRVSRLARLWNAPLYSTWEELLAVHGDAELAYVLVPHNAMREVCLALIAQRIPLVVEKPAGVSLQEMTDIREAAEAAGVPIAVPLVQRGGPTDRWLAKAGSSVYESVQFIAGPPDRYLTNNCPWVVDLERAGGGWMINLAPHFVDLFLCSTSAGDPTVTAALSSMLHQRSIEDYASLTLTTADGCVGSIEVGYAFPDPRSSGTAPTCGSAPRGRQRYGRMVVHPSHPSTVPLRPRGSTWTATPCMAVSSTRSPSSWRMGSQISLGFGIWKRR